MQRNTNKLQIPIILKNLIIYLHELNNEKFVDEFGTKDDFLCLLLVCQYAFNINKIINHKK